jgi:hypothetical protein
MTVSVVLRLTPAALEAGRLAGEVEVVATGERAVVKDAEDLLAFLRRSRPESRASTDADGSLSSR